MTPTQEQCCGRTDGTCYRCPTKPWPPQHQPTISWLPPIPDAYRDDKPDE